MERVIEVFKHFLTYFTMITLIDVIDIICLTVVLYIAYRFVKERRAGKLVLGIGFLAVFLLICQFLSLKAMKFILLGIFDVGIVLIVIVFQPELRAALEKMGDNSIKGVKSIAGRKNNTQITNMIEEVVGAIFDLAKSKTGALIIFERNTKLGDVILTGTVLDAELSGQLVKNVFFNKAPLHDGAMIVRDSRIHSAGCTLPLSANPNISKDLGTRHKAAIGVSENSDCVAVAVSEETGVVSIANNGHLRRNLTKSDLKEKLFEFLGETTNREK